MIGTIDDVLRAAAAFVVRKAAARGRNKRLLLKDAATLRVLLLGCIGAGSVVTTAPAAAFAVSLCCAALAAGTLSDRRRQDRLAADLDSPGGYAREMLRTGRAAAARRASMPGVLLSEAAVVAIVALLAAGSAWKGGPDGTTAGFSLWLAHTLATVAGSYVSTVPPAMSDGRRAAGRSVPAEAV